MLNLENLKGNFIPLFINEGLKKMVPLCVLSRSREIYHPFLWGGATVKKQSTAKPIQTALFEWLPIRTAHLIAINHPRPVYYNMWLEGMRGIYRVRKISGIEGRKPDRREWRFESLKEAEKEFDRKLKSKTNLNRKSPRKYVIKVAEAQKVA